MKQGKKEHNNRTIKIKENQVIDRARKFLKKQISLSCLQKAYADYEAAKEKTILK
jgi:uncharacterized protein YpiB (UPF0302 family)